MAPETVILPSFLLLSEITNFDIAPDVPGCADYWLDVLLFLLPIVLLLDIFYRVTTEVVDSVIFRDNVSTPGLGATNLCGKSPDFCLDLRSLDPGEVLPECRLVRELAREDHA